jgi:hypothetical protein
LGGGEGIHFGATECYRLTLPMEDDGGFCD